MLIGSILITITSIGLLIYTYKKTNEFDKQFNKNNNNNVTNQQCSNINCTCGNNCKCKGKCRCSSDLTKSTTEVGYNVV